MPRTEWPCREGVRSALSFRKEFCDRLVNYIATMRRFFRQPTLILLFCLLIAAVLFATPYLRGRLGWLDPAGAMDRLELYTVDQRFVIRGPRPTRPDIAIIGVDEVSLREMKARYGRFPWPRSVHARLIDRLRQAGAAVVAFDIVFDLPTPEAEDEAMAKAIHRSGRVVLASEYEPTVAGGGRGEEAADRLTVVSDSESLETLAAIQVKVPHVPDPAPLWLGPETTDTFWTHPLGLFARGPQGATIGFINTRADSDAIFRRARLVYGVNDGTFYPHLALAAAAVKLGVPIPAIQVSEDGIRLGSGAPIPVEADGTFPIDFAGGPTAFPRYSYSKVLGMPLAELRDEFHDKILFVGATALGSNDVRPSPYAKGYRGGDDTNLGVYTNANLADALLQRRFFHRPGWLVTALILLVIALYLGRVLAVYPMWEAIGAAGILTVAYVLVGVATFQGMLLGKPFLLPMAAPLLSILVDVGVAMSYRFRVEYNERKRHRQYLDRYLAPEVAALLVDHPEAARLGSGERREVTVLFADIRGFTPMSERMAPEEVSALLCRYYTEMVGVVMGHKGMVNNFVGDALVAVYNAPMDQPDHARRAMLTGLEMLRVWEKVQEEWRTAGQPTFRIGIGINTGKVFAGNIGMEQRLQYTVVGDTVNAAARLESLNKELGTSLLVGQATYERVADLVEVRPLPPVLVKGKSEPLQVYEVFGLRGESPASMTAPPAPMALNPPAKEGIEPLPVE
jgi:adenylate cyclase